MKTREHIAYIGLGANLGDPQQAVTAAIDALGALRNTKVVRASSLYLSAPIDATGDDYLNAVAAVCTQLSPKELLTGLQTIEQQFGRTRPYQNAPRTLDLDLLLYDQMTVKTESLQVPHPRMTQRAFVMLPLLEIAPEIVIPGCDSLHSLLPDLQNQRIKKL